ncbi:hypothetical protein LWC34_35285 [Kibdelosporangium philippinense]|uniref:Uncharacterized protein n=1 Tax=Kibdelosporangium philippinense TaxID=211113 RepID=A0ABS8ZM71_9PSEU|nr:hypothetical protein [Kibdelosporangium philippinense]MCE7008050.1 hypothetical protein [Kibdelosporangium philippinense]
MNAEELQAALHSATPDLEPRPTLTADVMRGGVRRQRNRRMGIAAATLAAAALVTTTASFGWQILSEPNQVATDPLMLKPTRGDLANDKAFIDDVLDAWEDKEGSSASVITRPHVYWAGNTPAGRAAVVMQETEGHALFKGLVGIDPKTQQLRTLITDAREAGYQFGPENRFVLVVPRSSEQLMVSDKVTYDNAAGIATRSWRPLHDVDGVMMAELPPGNGPTDAQVIVGNPDDGITQDELVQMYYADDAPVMAAKHAPAGLGWGEEGKVHMMWARPGQPPLHWNDPEWLQPRWYNGLSDTDLLDPTTPFVPNVNPWFVSVAGPDTTTFVISEYTPLHSGPSRLYALTMLRTGELGKTYSLGATRPDSPLPVLVDLPDDSAKVAVAKGAKLSYRTTKDGSWTEDADEALRIPHEAVEIRVTVPGKEPAIVPANR